MTGVDNSSPYQETQPIDSPPSSPSNSGEEDKGHQLGNYCDDEFLQDTQPFEDDAWINNEYLEDTQVINNDEYLETQVINNNEYLEDTQVVDNECINDEFLLCGETQVEPLVEEATQLLDGFDGLAATQVLEEDHLDDEIVADSDGYATDVLDNNSDNEENGQDGDEEFKVKTTGGIESLSNEHRSNKTARKLFVEDLPEEDNLPLSYIDSQEPGEASQANALNLVDKLISESRLEFAFEIGADGGSRIEEKSLSIPSVKGPQALAKIVSAKGKDVGKGTFDWDDNCEDEGGGNILSRRKEELFGVVKSKTRISSTVLREQKRVLAVDKKRAQTESRLTMGRKIIQATKKNLSTEFGAVSGNDTLVASEVINDHRKKRSPVEERGLSNGGVITRQTKGTKRIQAMKKASPSPAKSSRKNMKRSSNVTDRSASRVTRRNLVDSLNDLSTETNTNTREEIEAGPDTQMAVEAINLLSGDGMEIDTEPNSVRGNRSSRGVVTRKSKRINGIQSLDSEVESLKPKTKKARSTLSKACEKDTTDEVLVLSYPKGRRSARRISQDEVNEAERSSVPASDTPVNKSKMPSNKGSPICMGDEYHRVSCKGSRKSRELQSLTLPSVEPVPKTKSKRKRRDLASIRVLFSQHLDDDVTKHQKKILAKFGISEASSMIEATYFIADSFMRTRNMLEAIASGKPVVTTQWLESIDQVNIYVDEDLYILRDSKKEKEFGFNMGASLTRARQSPLLKGRRVFITPNTKPGLNTITMLVKAVHGLPVERLGRSALSQDKVSEDLLVLSCEEDRDMSIPFLERGAEVYSSELLLNGIVTQKLEYERYRLFADNVRKTRSTLWIRDGKGEFKRRRG